MPLLITFALGLFFLVGVIFVKIIKNSEILEEVSIAAAFGALCCIVALDLLPDILEAYRGASVIFAILLTALGLAVLKVLDMFVPDHEAEDPEENLVHIGFMSVIAISIHNIVEGMTVYSIASQSISAGISLGVGVGLHNIPMGMLICTALQDEKKGKKGFFISAAILSTFIGGFIMFCIQGMMSAHLLDGLVCIALGMVLFIILFELLPSILRTHRHKVRSIVGIAIGVAFVALSLLLESR